MDATESNAAPDELAPARTGATAHIVVLYNHPKDAAEFERYYSETHVPLVGRNAKEIGITHAELVKFGPGPDGSAPAFYRKAELWFDSPEARAKGMQTPGFAAVAGDLANFATGGLTLLLGERTHV